MVPVANVRRQPGQSGVKAYMRSAALNSLMQVAVVAVMTVFLLVLSAILLPPQGSNAMPHGAIRSTPASLSR
jgi:hypothetical protein